MGNLYTIGHSILKYDLFRELLKKYNIDCLLDVRSVPYSKYIEQYNRDIISQYLNMDNIRYVYAGRYFGARQADIGLYDMDGCLDFEKVRQTSLFQSMLNNVQKGLQEGHNVALMCTEKEPYDCHRAIMVGRGFELASVPIAHIRHDGSIMSQDELNEYLLDRYFPHRNQLELSFGNDDAEITDEDRLIEAYRKRNKEIGYNINSQVERIG